MFKKIILLLTTIIIVSGRHVGIDEVLHLARKKLKRTGIDFKLDKPIVDVDKTDYELIFNAVSSLRKYSEMKKQ